MTNPKHLFASERLASCSDLAQLHYSRFILTSNTLGRTELTPGNIRRAAYPTIRDQPTDEQIFGFINEYSENFLLFVYVDPVTGAPWGQWLIPDTYLANYQTAEDKRTPAPNEKAIAAYRQSYYDKKRRKSMMGLNISKPHQSVPGSPECSESSESVRLVVVDVGVDVAGEVEERDTHTPPAALATVPAAVSVSVSKTQSKKTSDKKLPTPQQCIDAWNQSCGELAKVQSLTQAEQRQLKVRIAEGTITPEKLREALAVFLATPFLLGKVEGHAWSITFVWLIKESGRLQAKIDEYSRAAKPKPEPKVMSDFAEQLR
jgi:hypothetical protein